MNEFQRDDEWQQCVDGIRPVFPERAVHDASQPSAE
jgi:hypothetical protein